MASALDDLGERIDTDGKPPARVAEEILARIVGEPRASLLSAETSQSVSFAPPSQEAI